MKTIREKILRSFTTIVISLVAVSFVLIYFFFSEFIEEEFQQRQKEKILTTLQLLGEIKEMNENLAQAMDEITIHDFYDEKILIYNSNLKIIYSSIDDLPISISQKILEKLNDGENWIETKEENYDVIGLTVYEKGEKFYGISKAYNEFGITKLNFLGYVLFGLFIVIVLVIFIVSSYISKKIAEPILFLTKKINNLDLTSEQHEIYALKDASKEVLLLTEKFNLLIQRTQESINFQKQAINHISHELKTPIAILVSNLEKIEQEEDVEKIKKQIEAQKINTKSLASIINTLLEISKIDTNQNIKFQQVRIDEIIFDVITDLKGIYEDFQFNLEINVNKSDDLILHANVNLMKSAFSNILKNSIIYNDTNKTHVLITSNKNTTNIEIISQGDSIEQDENRFLFTHFFRGENSRGKTGFGLGLVMVKKIIEIHQGKVYYLNPKEKQNNFTVELPKLKH